MHFSDKMAWWKPRWDTAMRLWGPHLTPRYAAQVWQNRIDTSRTARLRFISMLTGKNIQSFTDLSGDELKAVGVLMDLYPQDLQSTMTMFYSDLVPNGHRKKAPQTHPVAPAGPVFAPGH